MEKTINQLYANERFKLFPINKDKKPAIGGWQKNLKIQYTNLSTLAGVQIPPGIIVIDVDVKDNKCGRQSLDKLSLDCGIDLDEYITVITPSGGVHLYFEFPIEYRSREKNPDAYPDIDFLAGFSGEEMMEWASKACRYYAVCAGSVSESGKYQLANDATDLVVRPLPPSLLPILFYSPAEQEELAVLAREDAKAREKANKDLPAWTVADLSTMLAKYPALGLSYELWQETIMMSARSLGEKCRDSIHDWSAKDKARYDFNAVDNKITDCLGDIRDGDHKRPDNAKLTMATLKKRVDDIVGGDLEKKMSEVISGCDYSLKDILSTKWYIMKNTKNPESAIYHSKLERMGITANTLSLRAERGGYADLQALKKLKSVSFTSYLNRMHLVDDTATAKMVLPHYEDVLVKDYPLREGKSIINIFDWEMKERVSAIDIGGKNAIKCQQYLDLLRRHCHGLASGVKEDGDAAFYWMLMAWQLVKPLPYALAITGGKGIGKTTLTNLSQVIIGEDYLARADARTLTSRFNSELYGKAMIAGDELHKAGTTVKYLDAFLRPATTEGTIRVEPKGVDAFTFYGSFRILLTSNETKFINYEEDERRYVVLICDAQNSKEFVAKYAPEYVFEHGEEEAHIKYYDDLNAPCPDENGVINDFGKVLRSYVWQTEFEIPEEYCQRRPYQTSFHEEFISNSRSSAKEFADEIKYKIEQLADDPLIGKVVNPNCIHHETLAAEMIKDGYGRGQSAKQFSTEIGRYLTKMSGRHVYHRAHVHVGRETLHDGNSRSHSEPCYYLSIYKSKGKLRPTDKQIEDKEIFKDEVKRLYGKGTISDDEVLSDL